MSSIVARALGPLDKAATNSSTTTTNLGSELPAATYCSILEHLALANNRSLFASSLASSV
jgi:hypothetical protein